MIKIVLPVSHGDNKNYTDALRRSGMEPVKVHSLENIPLLDGLLLPGGVDINPKRYREENIASQGIDDELDKLQLSVLDAYVKACKPVLGICRGHQLINVYFGGTLFQNLDTAEDHKRLNYSEQYHRTDMVLGSVLHMLYGEVTVTNSTHHQGVKTPGEGLSVIAMAEDGIVEGIAHGILPVLGVQWHPERMPETGGKLLFDFFKELVEGKRIW